MIKTNTANLGRIYIISGIILILFTIIVIWSIPRGNGDLAISLAAGNDVLSGRLNQPDHWSFSTGGRIWMNQNWGAGVIFALVNNVFGDTGLLGLKMVLLLLTALFLALALKELKIPVLTALTVTAVIMLSLNIFTILRPNLFTITLLSLELWLLYKTNERPHLIWLVVAVMIFWANVHGGFIYGLGVQWLWTAYLVVPQLIKNKKDGLKHSWPLLAGALAALLGAGLLNPFGFTNLTFPFMMVNSSDWQVIKDWQPIWAQGLFSFGIGIINFLVIIGLIVLLFGLRLGYQFLIARQARKQGASGPGAAADSHTGLTVFDLALAVLSATMAVYSNRFIPIALIMAAPVLAKQLAWLGRQLKQTWIVPAGLSAVTLVYGLLILSEVVRNYDPAHPFMYTGSGSMADRMHYNHMAYDYELARFINKNNISGNTFSPWSWEGFLRLNCPQLRTYIGGRAQQIYDVDTLNRYLYVIGTEIPAFSGQYVEDIFDSIDAHLIIASHNEDSEELILTALNLGNWVIIYADDAGLLFANTQWPATAALVEQLAADQLVFEKYVTKAMSKAAFILSQPDLWKSEGLIDLFTEALGLQPDWLWSYRMLYTYCRGDAQLFNQVIDLMKKQLASLEGKALDRSNAGSILNCRMYLAAKLAEVARHYGQQAMYEQMQASYQQAELLYAGLIKKWQQVFIN